MIKEATMSLKYHMKKDESGPAVCNANVKQCPNGDFGHWSNEAEVWEAYEAVNFDKTLSSTLSKKTIQDKARRQSYEDKKEALADLRKAKTSLDREIALSSIPPGDAVWERFADSSEKDERIWAAQKINGSKSKIIDFIEYENDPEVLEAFAKNPTLEKADAKKIFNKLKTVATYDQQPEFFVKDYSYTMRKTTKTRKTLV